MTDPIKQSTTPEPTPFEFRLEGDKIVFTEQAGTTAYVAVCMMPNKNYRLMISFATDELSAGIDMMGAGAKNVSHMRPLRELMEDWMEENPTEQGESKCP